MNLSSSLGHWCVGGLFHRVLICVETKATPQNSPPAASPKTVSTALDSPTSLRDDKSSPASSSHVIWLGGATCLLESNVIMNDVEINDGLLAT